MRKPARMHRSFKCNAQKNIHIGYEYDDLPLIFHSALVTCLKTNHTQAINEPCGTRRYYPHHGGVA